MRGREENQRGLYVHDYFFIIFFLRFFFRELGRDREESNGKQF